MPESATDRLLRERAETFQERSQDWKDGYRAALNDLQNLHLEAFRFTAEPRRCF